MGQAIAQKLERRRLRRIVGDEAPQLFADFEQRIAALERAQVQNAKAASDGFSAHRAEIGSLQAWRGSTWWGRVRWLITGR